MKYYLALDGGGTKLQAILFDETGAVLSTGLAGGINGNVHAPEEVQLHFHDCMRQIFLSLDKKPEELEAVFLSQGMEHCHAIVNGYARVKRICAAGEGTIGLLACGLKSGFCALSGTGSDIFYVENAREIRVFGGWGYLMSDDGSGIWIGAQAVRSWILAKTKIEKPTLLHAMIDETYPELKRSGSMLEAVYRHKSPPYYIGTYCRVVNRAAMAGDETAIGILKEAGILLAKDTCRLIASLDVSKDMPIGLTGSVFRHCTVMRESFAEYMHRAHPDMAIHRPRFEPVVGAMIYGLLQAGHTLDEDMMKRLEENCRAYRITDEL